MTKKYFYEKSNLHNFKSNITYGKLVRMSKKEFNEWMDEMRAEVLDEWDNKGCPPAVGKTEVEIRKSMKGLRAVDTRHFIQVDESPDSLEWDAIMYNFSKRGSEVNQFFPDMMKTKITFGKDASSGISIYDSFTDQFEKKFRHALFRVLYNDSMYLWSKGLSRKSENNPFYVSGESPVDTMRAYHNGDGRFDGYGLRISKLGLTEKKKSEEYTNAASLTADEIRMLYHEGSLEDWQITYLGDVEKLVDSRPVKNGKSRQHYLYQIRVFEENTKIFPTGLQVLRIGMGLQPAVNFPPLNAKCLYETFTQHIPYDQQAVVYDPSSGWGGRILGAMSCKRPIHYVGTDPNTNNFIDELGITRYEYVANYYLDNVVDATHGYVSKFFDVKPTHTHHVFTVGSEEIGSHPDFQQYYGNVDFVFTSPPYFNREQYSDDDSQSFKKFSEYDDWKEYFLRPTLETAYKALKSDRYLCWNIADIRISDGVYYPLEQDSIDILTELGMEYKGKIKMVLSSMIGVDRESTVANSVEYNGSHYKYEPIFVFKKP